MDHVSLWTGQILNLYPPNTPETLPPLDPEECQQTQLHSSHKLPHPQPGCKCSPKTNIEYKQRTGKKTSLLALPSPDIMGRRPPEPQYEQEKRIQLLSTGNPDCPLRLWLQSASQESCPHTGQPYASNLHRNGGPPRKVSG